MNYPIKLRSGFTLLELLTVMVVIAVLAALILNGAGYAQQKAARSRAEAEIAAMSVALESYKADNGEYVDTAETRISPTAEADNAAYASSMAMLTAYLSGAAAIGTSAEDSKDETLSAALDQGAKFLSRWKRYLELPTSSFSTQRWSD